MGLLKNDGRDLCLWIARCRADSLLSPGGDIPPPGGGQELLFYGKCIANLAIFED